MHWRAQIGSCPDSVRALCVTKSLSTSSLLLAPWWWWRAKNRLYVFQPRAVPAEPQDQGTRVVGDPRRLPGQPGGLLVQGGGRLRKAVLRLRRHKRESAKNLPLLDWSHLLWMKATFGTRVVSSAVGQLLLDLRWGSSLDGDSDMETIMAPQIICTSSSFISEVQPFKGQFPSLLKWLLARTQWPAKVFPT